MAEHVLALNAVSNKNLIKIAMADWYEQKEKNFEEWKKKYPAPVLNDIVHDNLKQHLNWCQLTEITSTPTILVDGYKLPYPYVLNDLKYF